MMVARPLDVRLSEAFYLADERRMAEREGRRGSEDASIKVEWARHLFPCRRDKNTDCAFI